MKMNLHLLKIKIKTVLEEIKDDYCRIKENNITSYWP